jgi:integrase
MSRLLSDALDDYLVYRRTAFKRGTALASEQSLKQFLSVVGNIQTRTLAPRHAERFQSWLLTSGKKPNTVNGRMSQLSAFSKWLVAHRLVPTNFCGTVRIVPVPRRPRLRVAATDFQRLLDTANRPDRRLVIALGLFLFLRSGEIRTLRVGDVDLDAGILHVTVHKGTEQVDEMPICYELDQELRRWFVTYAADIRRPLHAADVLVPAQIRRPGWMGQTPDGNYRPERMMLRPYDAVRATLAAAGYPVMEDGKKAGEGVHTLRRSGARAMYDAMVDGRLGDSYARDDALRQVMTMLHHSSVTITEHYIGLERDRARRDQTIRGARMIPLPADNVISLKEAK